MAWTRDDDCNTAQLAHSLVLVLTLLAFLPDHRRGLCEALMPQSFSKRRKMSFTRSPVPTYECYPTRRRTLDIGSRNEHSIALSSESTDQSQSQSQIEIEIEIETTHIHIPIPILLETDHVFVVNKPTGISHHDSDNELGILNVLRRQQEQGLLSSSSYSGRLYGVHRLDRVTSGILVLAKDAPTARRLTAAFRQGLVTKYYMGISRHKPAAKKQGWVTGGMVRGRRKSWQLTRDTKNNNGGNGNNKNNNSNDSIPNYARTRFFTAGLGGLSDALVQDERQQLPVQPKTLLLFRPYTGRTHQLRVAAKSVGLPLAGDPVYSDGWEPPDTATPTSATSATTATTTTQRTYLHATGFHLPGSEDDGTDAITIWSPPPFDHLWNEAGQDDFHTIFYNLVHKHCDCPAILEILE
jgi:23S rRNA-/tRNA-specific pseudouridylate synthase